jgi:hypothetical protein
VSRNGKIDKFFNRELILIVFFIDEEVEKYVNLCKLDKNKLSKG